MTIKSDIERVPRGTLVVTIGVVWSLLLASAAFMFGDFYHRISAAEQNIANLHTGLTVAENQNKVFEAWILRVEGKLDRIIYDEFGMTFGNKEPDTIQLRYEEPPTF